MILAIPLLVSISIFGVNLSKTDMTALNMVNDIRIENNLSPVSYNAHLGRSSMTKACDMRDKGYITHISPDGKLWEVFYEAGYYFKSAGENLAKECTDKDCVTLWMQSTKHRANILDPRFKEGAISRCGDSLVLHLGTQLTIKEKLQIMIFRIKTILKQEIIVKTAMS